MNKNAISKEKKRADSKVIWLLKNFRKVDKIKRQKAPREISPVSHARNKKILCGAVS